MEVNKHENSFLGYCGYKGGCCIYQFINLRKTTFYCILLGATLVVYIMLAWLQIFPSVAHIHVIHKLWDSNYAKCANHKERQLLQTSIHRAKLYVTVSFSGRLGNWMYAYASLYGIARANNRILYINSVNPLNQVFDINIPGGNVMCTEPIREIKPCAYDSRLMNLPFANITVFGYIQSWKYFQDFIPEIRHQFKFQPYITSIARHTLSTYIYKTEENFDILTCIHVRRTDMGIPSSTRLGFKMAPLEYILNAKNYLTNKYKQEKMKFLVLSDDFDWCSRNLNFSDTVVLYKNEASVDLAILSMCNHSIITTGTFGWWGAFLAGGDTIYYSGYPEPGSRLDQDMVKADHYPMSWIPINVSCYHRLQTFNLLLLLLFTYVLI